MAYSWVPILRKDPRIIEPAYNDTRGVTALFNSNILARINRELGADFKVGQFAHRAFYQASHHRIEMHLISRCDQCVQIDDAEFFFAAGESIRTEYSYKFSLCGLRQLAVDAGFTTERIWTDPQQYFSVCYFKSARRKRKWVEAEMREE